MWCALESRRSSPVQADEPDTPDVAFSFVKVCRESSVYSSRAADGEGVDDSGTSLAQVKDMAKRGAGGVLVVVFVCVALLVARIRVVAVISVALCPHVTGSCPLPSALALLDTHGHSVTNGCVALHALGTCHALTEDARDQRSRLATVGCAQCPSGA